MARSQVIRGRFVIVTAQSSSRRRGFSPALMLALSANFSRAVAYLENPSRVVLVVGNAAIAHSPRERRVEDRVVERGGAGSLATSHEVVHALALAVLLLDLLSALVPQEEENTSNDCCHDDDTDNDACGDASLVGTIGLVRSVAGLRALGNDDGLATSDSNDNRRALRGAGR